jgi:hypothetical protein
MTGHRSDARIRERDSVGRDLSVDDDLLSCTCLSLRCTSFSCTPHLLESFLQIALDRTLQTWTVRGNMDNGMIRCAVLNHIYY